MIVVNAVSRALGGDRLSALEPVGIVERLIGNPFPTAISEPQAYVKCLVRPKVCLVDEVV